MATLNAVAVGSNNIPVTVMISKTVPEMKTATSRISSEVSNLSEIKEAMLVSDIASAQNRLLNAIKSYYTEAMNRVSMAPIGSSLERRINHWEMRFYHKQLFFFTELFENFSINSFNSITYNGTMDSRPEPVRRVTQYILEALREADKPNSEEILTLFKEYETYLEKFLRIVR